MQAFIWAACSDISYFVSLGKMPLQSMENDLQSKNTLDGDQEGPVNVSISFPEEVRETA